MGGVSERPIRKARRSNPSPCPGRSGGRHPDLRDAGSLRGMPEKRESRPVRLVRLGLVPTRAVAPATAGCPLDAEEGNVVSMRQAHALVVETPKKRSPPSRTRPSLGPEARARHRHQTPLIVIATTAKVLVVIPVSRAWRGLFGIAVGQTCASRRNRHRGRSERTDECTARRVSPPSRRKLPEGSCVMRQKRKEVMAFVPARKRELRFVVRTSC